MRQKTGNSNRRLFDLDQVLDGRIRSSKGPQKSVLNQRKTNLKIAANNKKIAKKAKIAHENSSKTTVNLDFGNLKMAPLEHYKIPMCISDIENKTDARYLTSIEANINNSASDPEQYTQAYAALLYFIETAESITLQEFNEKYIRLSYSKIGRTFQIENAVSLKL